MMAKDPAFLFYPGDFLGGTQFFTDDELGKYVRLLIAQFNMGHLYEKDMLKICENFNERIFSKFVRDPAGLYFNKRLEIEIENRHLYSQSRSKNRRKGTSYVDNMSNTPRTYDRHMENENENMGGVGGNRNPNGSAKPPPTEPEIPAKYFTAWINKRDWFLAEWEKYYKNKFLKDPEFCKLFGYEFGKLPHGLSLGD